MRMCYRPSKQYEMGIREQSPFVTELYDEDVSITSLKASATFAAEKVVLANI